VRVIAPDGRGVCGLAVAEQRNINVPDVSKAPNYLACSTATRSELVVLIRKGGTIYAQIDIDSHELDAFDPGTVAEVEKVADHLARVYANRDRGAAGGTRG
jgi:L-methionine (R)-S-oxide reductase